MSVRVRICLSWLLALALVWTLVPAMAFAEGDETEEGEFFDPVEEAPVVERTTFTHQYGAALYEPETSLVNAPSVVWDARTAPAFKLVETCSGAVRPQVVEVNVQAGEAGLVVKTSDGTCGLYEFVKATEASVIPALFVGDAATADALVGFCSAYGLQDAFVIGSEQVVKRVVSKTTGIRGVVDMTSRSAMSQASLAAVPGKVYGAGARAVLFENGVLSAKQIAYLRNRFTSVWLAAGPSLGPTEAVAAVAAGADGVACCDYEQLYDALATFDDENALAAIPRITGHRGSAGNALENRSGHAENTIAAYKWAVAQGAAAIETDVWLVDNKLVIKHTRPTSAGKLLTLKEVLTTFQNTDVVVHIELKSAKKWSAAKEKTYANACVSKIASLMNLYPKAKDNVVFASFYSSMIKAVNAKMPWAPRAFIATFGNAKSNDRYTRSVQRQAAYNLLEDWCSVYGPSYKQSTAGGTLGKVFAEGLHDRAVSMGYWVANGADLDELIVRDCSSVTTDTADRASGYSASVSLTGVGKQTVYVGCNEQGNRVENLDLGALVTVKTQKGAIVHNPELRLTSVDGGIVERDDGSYAFADAANLESKALVSYTQAMQDGTTYTVYSDPVTFKGVMVNDADNAVNVVWKDGSGEALETERYYVTVGEDGAAALEPRPAYKRVDPVPAATAKGHYALRGWRDVTGDTWDVGTLAPLAVDDIGHTLEYTADVVICAHKPGAVATCQHAQVCTQCNMVLHDKTGHVYRGGICTMCGKVAASSKVALKRAKAKKNSITLAWKKKSGSAGYRIQYRKKGTSAWKRKTVSAKTAKKVIAKLKRKTRYQFRVRSYTVVNGMRVYGTWSNTKTVKTKRK